MSIDHGLRNLRHLYEQMISGAVRATPEDVARAATGLLGPAIEHVERAQSRIARLESLLGEAEGVIGRLMLYAQLHEQSHPGWNGNRFDDVRLAEKALAAIRAEYQGSDK